MIIARLVDRIDVEEGNKVTIKYRVSFEQFMSKEQATAQTGPHSPQSP